MKKILLLCSLLIPAAVAGQDAVDENAMFSNPDAVVVDAGTEVDDGRDAKHFGVSGELHSINKYYMSRGFILDGEWGDNRLDPYMLGLLILDARLPDGVKGIAGMETSYNARTAEADYSIKELFVQFNLSDTLYITAGKQVLTWGRCYLWNPTDLVNIERKSFFKKIGSYEGTYGMKAHVPFGTTVNMYAFAGTLNTADADDISGAYKFEFLIGTFESALSVWGKKNYNPVYAFDFSTRLLTLDILGEAGVSWGSNQKKIRERELPPELTAVIENSGGVIPMPGGMLDTYREEDKIIPKASINIGRSFDLGDQADKIMIKAEFFYNGDGYRENAFSDGEFYIYDKAVTYENPETGEKSDSTVSFKAPDGEEYEVNAGPKALYLIANNLYSPNYYSRYYAAIFTSVNKFFISELTLSMNLIGNIPQRSFILMGGLDYTSINNFKFSFYADAYLGKKNTEYTAAGYAADVMLSAGIIF